MDRFGSVTSTITFRLVAIGDTVGNATYDLLPLATPLATPHTICCRWRHRWQHHIRFVAVVDTVGDTTYDLLPLATPAICCEWRHRWRHQWQHHVRFVAVGDTVGDTNGNAAPQVVTYGQLWPLCQKLLDNIAVNLEVDQLVETGMS